MRCVFSLVAPSVPVSFSLSSGASPPQLPGKRNNAFVVDVDVDVDGCVCKGRFGIKNGAVKLSDDVFVSDVVVVVVAIDAAAVEGR